MTGLYPVTMSRLCPSFVFFFTGVRRYDIVLLQMVFSCNCLGPAGCMQIFVRLLSGKVVTVVMEESETIKDLKEKVQNQEGLPSNRQVLLFGCVQLDDESTLSGLGVTDKDSLCVFTGMQGKTGHSEVPLS